MTERAPRMPQHQLQLTVRSAPDGSDWYVDAECHCGVPNRHGGHGWSYMAAASTPQGGASIAAGHWAFHVAEADQLARRALGGGK